MGNRAVITNKDKQIGIYLHWNGGRESIDGFLAYCKAMDYRAPDEDCYGWACLAQTIRNFFGSDGLSCGIDVYNHLDTNNGDNGVYIIEDWKVVGREFNYNKHEKPTKADYLTKVVEAINAEQPGHSQLSERGIAIAVNGYLAQYENDNALPPAEESKELQAVPDVKQLPASTTEVYIEAEIVDSENP